MRFTTRKRRQPPTVIIISLIDILIVLLIFMMVTTTFQQPKPAIKLTLPESKEGKPGGDDKSMIVVTISKGEPYYHLGNRPVTLDKLQQELVAKITQSPGARLFIRADTDSSVGRLFKVRDAANAAKFTDVKVFVKPAVQP
jgi:Biopolymer transport protein